MFSNEEALFAVSRIKKAYRGMRSPTGTPDLWVKVRIALVKQLYKLLVSSKINGKQQKSKV